MPESAEFKLGENPDEEPSFIDTFLQGRRCGHRTVPRDGIDKFYGSNYGYRFFKCANCGNFIPVELSVSATEMISMRIGHGYGVIPRSRRRSRRRRSRRKREAA